MEQPSFTRLDKDFDLRSAQGILLQRQLKTLWYVSWEERRSSRHPRIEEDKGEVPQVPASIAVARSTMASEEADDASFSMVLQPKNQTSFKYKA